jgi:hypothetical protein
MPHCASFSCE